MPPLTDQQKEAFAKGNLDLKGQFTLGSNYTFLVEIEYQDSRLQAVYKPIRGEQPLWDFPVNSLAARETAAYLLSEALGWDIVPYTTLRQEAPFGEGSLQQYIPYNPHYHYFNFRAADKKRLDVICLFDLLVNNADRKGSHILLETGTKHLYAIDQGLCFHEEEKLRTVIWDFAGQAIPPHLLAALQTLPPQLEPSASLYAALQPLLSPAEINALSQRTLALLSAPLYPAPPEDRRAYPYPPL